MKEYNIFICETCKNGIEYEHDEFFKHLEEAHRLNTKNLEGTREMIAHVDGRDHYKYLWKWTIGQLVFIQDVCIERDKDDPMRFA